MITNKILYKETVSGFTSHGLDVSLCIVGLFDSVKVIWTYYITPVIKSTVGELYITTDLVSDNSTSSRISNSSINTYGKKIKDIEEGKKFIYEFKTKWESGSNNSTAEMRDKKLEDILKS